MDISSMNARRLALAIALAAVTAAAAACGDDGDDDDGRADAPDAASGDEGPPDAATDEPAPQSVASSETWDERHAWTHLGYDARNHYHNTAEDTLAVDNAAHVDKLWTFEVDGYPAGSPVVAEGKVFVLASAGMFAIDLFTGEEVWSTAEIMGFSSVAYDDGHIYVHASPGANLYKLRASDGEVVWGPIRTYEAPHSDGTSSPVVAGDRVIVGRSTFSEIESEGREDAVGGMTAFDTGTGEQLWVYETVELPENGAMIWSTVGVDLDAGIVYATTGNNYTIAGPGSDAIHAVDLETGERLWMTQVRQDDVWSIADPPEGDTDFGANPIVVEIDGAPVIAAGDKAAAFWALDENGQVLWAREDLSVRQTTSTGGILNNGAFDGEYFYVLVNEPDPGNLTWEGDFLLYVLDPRNDGADVFEPKRIEGKITWGMPTLANGLLLVPADDELLILDKRQGEVLRRFETGGTIAAGGPVVSNGRIIVASGLQYPFGMVTDNNQVHCYGLPPLQ